MKKQDLRPWEIELRNKQYERVWNITLGIISAIVVLGVAAVAIATIVIDSQGKSFQRYTVDNPYYFGQVPLNSNDRTIGWDLQHTLPVSNPVLTIQIRGPIPPGMTDGPLHVAICGIPSTLVCDTSVAGVLNGELTETYQGNSLKTAIRAIRDFPRRYYVELGTALNTTGLRAPLGFLAGTAG